MKESKEGDHEVANNNRPISLLPILSKLAERVALGQFESENRKHNSTEMSLSLFVTD